MENPGQFHCLLSGGQEWGGGAMWINEMISESDEEELQEEVRIMSQEKGKKDEKAC